MKIVEIYQSRREIDILKMCQHQNVIRLIDFFENESYQFIVLEHCKGKNLYDYL
jgi:serine/threonine protein kinase